MGLRKRKSPPRNLYNPLENLVRIRKRALAPAFIFLNQKNKGLIRASLAAQIEDYVANASVYYALSFDPPRADHADEYHDLNMLVDKRGGSRPTPTLVTTTSRRRAPQSIAAVHPDVDFGKVAQCHSSGREVP